MYDAVAIGELLVDFIQEETDASGPAVYSANPGGAPCNLLAMMGKMGKKTAFIGKVGNDPLGLMLRNALMSAQISVENLCFDDKVPTTLAFVSKTPEGDRCFSFYRNPGADMMLEFSDVHQSLLKNTRLFHFGTLSMTHEKNREATKMAVSIAKANGAQISFDPNIRENLWDSEELLWRQITYGLQMCDILKISDSELRWITGEKDLELGILKLRTIYSIPLIFLTMGIKGSRCYYKKESIEVAACHQWETIETTGAGDTFFGIALSKVLDIGMENLNRDILKNILEYANVGAAIITSRKGAMSVMPELSEIEACMNMK